MRKFFVSPRFELENTAMKSSTDIKVKHVVIFSLLCFVLAILDEAFSFAIKKLTAVQLKWFLRIILKDLKLAMGTTRILAAFHPDAPELYESCGSLSKVSTYNNQIWLIHIAKWSG